MTAKTVFFNVLNLVKIAPLCLLWLILGILVYTASLAITVAMSPFTAYKNTASYYITPTLTILKNKVNGN